MKVHNHNLPFLAKHSVLGVAEKNNVHPKQIKTRVCFAVPEN